MNQVTNLAEIKLIGFIYLPQKATFNNTVCILHNKYWSFIRVTCFRIIMNEK